MNCRIVGDWAKSLPLAAVLLLWASVVACRAAGSEHLFSVRDNGAKGDGVTNDAAAIQRAIDEAAKAESGVVVFPNGDYLAGQLMLASHVTLRLEEGATLRASTNAGDYHGGAHSGTLLNARGAEDIVIEGGGQIDGQATKDFGKRWGAAEDAEFRTHLVRFEQCRNVTIRGVSFVNSDSWTIDLKRCDGVTLSHVKIRNNYRRLNSDGIDPDSCTHVRISDCDIVAGDDAIVLKSTEAFPCEDVVVKDCRLESASTALKLGTESHGDFRDVHFEHCVVRNSPIGMGIYIKDGAVVEKVEVKDVKIETSGPEFHDVTPLFIDIEKRNADSKLGAVRQVTFENIEITSGAGILIQGMPESPLENISLRNIRFQVQQPQDYAKRKKPVGGRRTTRDERDTLYARQPAYGAFAYVRGLSVENFAVQMSEADFQAWPRSALMGFHLNGGHVQGVTRTPAATALPVVDLRDSDGVTVETH